MKSPRQTRLALLCLLTLGNGASLVAQAPKPDAAVLRFGNADYLERWSKNTQHEFTPRGQEDLEHWADMVTTNAYLNTKNGEALAAVANAVLENYKSHQATVVRTDSIPRTPERPAEHLVVVLFPRPELSEVAFARFKLVNGVGASVVYSHREYGKQAGELMGTWLTKNGPATEKLLMGLEKFPAPGEVKK